MEDKSCVRLCTAKINCTEKPQHSKEALDEPSVFISLFPKVDHEASLDSSRFTLTAIER